MKAITLWQPWASLVACGAKRIEIRSWRTPHRGPLAIHAGKQFGPQLRALCGTQPFLEALATRLTGQGYDGPDALPLGALVCEVELVDCIRTEAAERYVRDGPVPQCGGFPEHELAFGDYSAGRWAWLFRDVRRLAEPVPCRGQMHLWDVPADAEAEVMRQLLQRTNA